MSSSIINPDKEIGGKVVDNFRRSLEATTRALADDPEISIEFGAAKIGAIKARVT